MPSERHTTNKGNLYIKFKIQFPDSGFLPSEDERKVLYLSHSTLFWVLYCNIATIVLEAFCSHGFYLDRWVLFFGMHRSILVWISTLCRCYAKTFILSPTPPQKLTTLLPCHQPDEPSEEAEEVDMIDFEGTKGEDGAARGEAYDSSDEENSGPGGPPRMGCTQQ